MRPIKFRAWDLLENKMIQWDELTSGKHPYNYLSMLASDLGIVIWMQFTGLTDSKGKEIYEGDIIKYFNRYGEKQKINPVVFDLGMFCINDDDIYVKLSQANRVEVIGNIYENPELLKENL